MDGGLDEGTGGLGLGWRQRLPLQRWVACICFIHIFICGVTVLALFLASKSLLLKCTSHCKQYETEVTESWWSALVSAVKCSLSSRSSGSKPNLDKNCMHGKSFYTIYTT